MSTIEDRIRERAVNAQTRAASQTIYATRSAQPDTAARANVLARSEGLPADVVERNLPDVESRIRARARQETVRQSTPHMQNWMADPRNAAAAGDDTTILANIADNERTIRKAFGNQSISSSRGPAPTWGSYIGGLLSGFAPGTVQMVEGLREKFALDTGYGGSEQIFDMKAGGWRYAENTPAEKGALQRNLIQNSQRRFNQAQETIDRARPEFKTKLAGWVYSGAASTVQMLPSMTASVIARSPVPMLAMAGVQTGLPSYARYIGQGATNEEATRGALGQAAIEIGTEMLPFGHLFNALTGKGGKGFVREMGKSVLADLPGEQIATLGQDAIDTALDPKGSWSQYWAGRGEAAKATLVATLTQGALMAGVGGTGRIMAHRANAKFHDQILDRVMDDAANVKLRETDPHAFEQFVAGAFQNTPIENVHIDAKAIRELYQDDSYRTDPFWGKYADQIDEAAAIGQAVVVPLSEAATYLADAPEWGQLRKHATLSPGGITQAEEQRSGEDYHASVEARTTLLSQLADHALKAAEPEAKVYAEYHQQLLDAGETPARAKHLAAIYAANATTFGALTGKDALAYHQSSPVEVRRVLPESLAKAVQPSDGLDAVVKEMRAPVLAGATATEATAPPPLRAAANELRQMLSARGVDPDTATRPQIQTALDEQRKEAIDGRELDQPERGTGRSAVARERAQTPLEGAPKVSGHRGPIADIVDAAGAYAEAAGIAHARQAHYVQVEGDPEAEAFSRRLADAYEEMEHNPSDPKVVEAYADLIRQTTAQYMALVKAGYSFSLFDDDSDPYGGSPGQAMADLRTNKHLAVYSTLAGFGPDGTTVTPAQNPLVAATGIVWPDQHGIDHPVLANDLFRAVHDAFGHGLEGAGFRVTGEENAWQAHARLFTGPALAALTTETRGQNSWLNSGPKGETNRTASLEETAFAEQKIGLLPEWAWTERRVGDQRVLEQSAAALQTSPLPIIGTGLGSRILNRDIGNALTKRHMDKYGRALDPADPADYKIIHEAMVEDYHNQKAQPDNGEAWYSQDIAEAMELTRAILPELEDPVRRDIFLTSVALLSPQQGPVDNWSNAIDAYSGYSRRGRFALIKPSGMNFGVKSHGSGLRLFQHLIGEHGEIGALVWLNSEHTGREMEAVRRASGVFSNKADNYLPKETNFTESKAGVYMFGPKVGDFAKNSTGIDQSAVTVDLWMARTYNRLLGKLSDVSDNARAEGALKDTVGGKGGRAMVTRLVRDAAKQAGIEPSAMQASLWYFEQRLYRAHGLQSDSTSFSQAARAALDDRGIEPASSASRTSTAQAGDAQTGLRELFQSPARQLLEPGEVAATDAAGHTTIGWKPERIDALLHRFAYSHDDTKTKAFAIRISPDEFLKLTASKDGRTLIENRVAGEEYGGQIDYGQMADSPITPVLIVNHQPGHTSISESGRKEIPAHARVMGHDGRHRMTMLKLAGVESVPVVVINQQGAPGETVDLHPQRSRSDQLASGDTAALGKQAIPLNYTNRERLVKEFGSGRVLFQSQPFFSSLERAAEGIKNERASADQWIATLRQAPGVKADEIHWTGIEDWLKLQSGPVDKTAVLAAIRDGGIKVEEVLLGRSDAEMLADYGIAEDDYESEDREGILSDGATQFDNYIAGPKGENQRELLITLPKGEGGNPDRQPSTHWDQEGVVAHARFSDVVAADGSKTLKIHEVQSDWHQKGRDQGYETKVDPAVVAAAQLKADNARRAYEDVLRAITEEGGEAFRAVADERPMRGSVDLALEGDLAIAQRVLTGDISGAEGIRAAVGAERFLDLRAAYSAGRSAVNLAGRELDIAKGLITNGGVPDAPFKTSWPALVMKRMIHWAAVNGYDKVVWTTGEQQAKLYNLSQSTGPLSIATRKEGGFFVRAQNEQANGALISNGLAQRQGSASLSDWVIMSEAQIKEAFGADVAKKLTGGIGESGRNTLEGEDLTVGGEGMKQFYDRNLVNITNGLIKKYGAKVEEVAVEGTNPERAKIDAEIQRKLGLTAYGIESVGEAKERIDQYEQQAERGEGDPAKARQWAHQLRQGMGLFEERDRLTTGTPQPGFTITPELREAASGGFSLFQKEGEAAPRGSVSGGIISGQPGPVIISLFENSDPTTVIHEMGHIYIERLREIALSQNAPPQAVADWGAMKQWAADNGLPISDDAPIPTEAHELFARGWEGYTMEGKAPVPRLQRAFDAMRSWMLSVYEVIQNLKAPITPEVRRVFDRMLATQQEIDDAADTQNMDARFENAEQAGMTGAEFAAYQQLADNARSEAFNVLLFKTMAAIRRERTQAWKEEERALRESVTAQANDRPDFRALHLLRTGKFLGDPEREAMPVKLDRQWVIDRFGEQGLAALPKGGVVPLFKEGGDSPDAIADLAGFRTGEEMIQALIGVEQATKALREEGDKRSVKQRTIDDEVQQTMAERHGDPLGDGTIEEEAVAAIHNERQGELIATENRQLAKRVNGHPTAYSLAREWARQKIARGKVNDVASRSAIQRYARAQTKAAKAFQDALVAKDNEEAFRQSEIRLINHALVAEASKAAEFVEKAVDRLSKIAKTATRKSIDQEYLERAHTLLEKFSFRPRSQRLINEQESYSKWAEGQRALGIDVAMPPRLENDGIHYSRMSVEELSGLNDSVMQLLHLGRFKQKLIDEKELRDYREVRDEMVAEARHNVGLRKVDPNIETTAISLRKRIVGMHAGLTKLGRIIDRLDGGRSDGLFNKHIWRPLANAMQRFNDIMEDVHNQGRASLALVPKDIKNRFADRVNLPEMPGTAGDTTYTRMQMHQMARNAGTTENWRVLCEGRGWDEVDAFAALDREMTREEWEYVQRDLDLVGSFWPQIKALYERINGLAPPQVVPKPIETRHGTFSGGYYPLVPDLSANPKLEQALRSDDLFNTLATRATTRNGFINERTGATYVVSLSPGSSQRHITEVVHDFTHREAIMQADRLLSDPQMITALRETVGPEIEGQFRPWLKHIANQWASEKNGLQDTEAFANKARTNMSIVGMGFRISTMLAQVAGYANSVEALNSGGKDGALTGAKWFASGWRSVVGMGHKDAYAFASERSGLIRHRLQSVDRTQEQELAKLEGKTGLKADVARFAYLGIGIMDHIVVLPTWHAGYNKAISEGLEEDDAIAFADKVVSNSQGAGGAMETSAIQRTKGLSSWLVMFYSYGAAYYNRQATLINDVRHAKTRDVPALMARTFWLMFAPNMISTIIQVALGQGPDDDENFASWFALQSVAGVFMGIPVAGGAIKSLASGFDFQASPIDRAVTTGINAAKDLWHTADDYVGLDPEDQTHASKRPVKNVVEAAGYISGTPTGPLANASQFLSDWASGDVDPDSVWDWLKGLHTGKLKDKAPR